MDIVDEMHLNVYTLPCYLMIEKCIDFNQFMAESSILSKCFSAFRNINSISRKNEAEHSHPSMWKSQINQLKATDLTLWTALVCLVQRGDGEPQNLTQRSIFLSTWGAIFRLN